MITNENTTYEKLPYEKPEFELHAVDYEGILCDSKDGENEFGEGEGIPY